MRRLPLIIAGTLVALFLLFSFNAYACLLPLFGAPQSTMGGCADEQEQPVRQFCDSFTILSIQSASDFYLCVDAPVVSPAELALAPLSLILTPRLTPTQDFPAQRPPQDEVVKTTVLRI